MKMMSANRITATACVGIVLGLTNGIQASVVIASGDGSSFVAPHPPYGPDRPVELELTIGYTGTPATTVGSGVWITQVGLYDLSGDPNLIVFFGYATNGTADPMTICIKDRDGFASTFEFSALGGWAEREFLGGNPDLAGLQPVGFQLRLESIDLSANGDAGVLVRWETRGVPEPISVWYVGAWLVLAVHRRRDS